MPKWIKKWKVEGSRGDIYTVAVDTEGNYGCSCPQWKFRRQECKHIKYIKQTKPEPEILIKPKKPTLVPAKIDHPVYDERNNVIMYPLVRIEPFDVKLEVEIDVFLMEHGYSWQEVREKRNLPRSWTKKAVYAYYNKHVRR